MSVDAVTVLSSPIVDDKDVIVLKSSILRVRVSIPSPSAKSVAFPIILPDALVGECICAGNNGYSNPSGDIRECV